jgi:bifunctional DNase/RNase
MRRAIPWLMIVSTVICGCAAEAHPFERRSPREIERALSAMSEPPSSVDDDVAPAPPTVEAPSGYVRMVPIARSGSFGDAVLLVDDERQVVVPIYIGGTEALSIQLRLAGRPFTRPLTHDLFDAFAERVGAKMLRAQVDRLEDRVFIGSVVLQRGQELILLDARPSDAIALAIGNGVAIFVSRAVVDSAGIRSDELDDEPPPTTDPIAL